MAPEKKGQANDIPATLVVVYYNSVRREDCICDMLSYFSGHHTYFRHSFHMLLVVVVYYCVSRVELTPVFLLFNNFNPY